jgi:hypothetical protein
MFICIRWAQLVLYRPFIHCLTLEEDKVDAAKNQRGYAIKCVNVAKEVIKASYNYDRDGLLCPASWPSVYTIFLSIICLVIAQASADRKSKDQHAKDSAEDDKLRQYIESGITMLARTACTADTGSVRCLELVRRLLEKTNQSVHIDLERIYMQTPRSCAEGNHGVIQSMRDALPSLEPSSAGADERSPSVYTPGWRHPQPTSVPVSSSESLPVGQSWSSTSRPSLVGTDSGTSNMSNPSLPICTSGDDQGVLHQTPTSQPDMMDVMYPGNFAWYQPGNAQLHAHGQGRPPLAVSTAATPSGTLSAYDIASLMRLDPDGR